MPSPDDSVPQHPGNQSLRRAHHRPEQHPRQQLSADSVLSVAASVSSIHWGFDGTADDREFYFPWTAVDRREEVLQWLTITGDVHLVEVDRRRFRGRHQCVLGGRL